MDDAASTVASRGPCPDCGSDHGLVTYMDGHKWCYSGCQQGKGRGEMSDEDYQPQVSKTPSTATPFTKEHMPNGNRKRKVSLETLTKFQYFTDSEGDQLAPYYDQQGRMVYQKARNKDKEFWFNPLTSSPPKPHECQLYGQTVWGERMDRKVIITEGEWDAMSVAQELNFKHAAVVSVPGGTGSALKALRANYRWLDRFEEVIFWFDNDEPGQALISEACMMFPGKAKVIKVEGFKDASDMLQAYRGGDIYGAVWSAVTYQPEGIVNAKDAGEDMEAPEAETIIKWPWTKTQEITLGIREGEVVYHVAGTGIGKTSQLVELQVELLKHNIKFGVMRFEDTRRKSQLDLMSVEAGRRLHLDPLPKEQLRELHSRVFGGGTVELFDPERANWDFESIQGYMRYMVLGLGCKVVFIDPLSFIVAGANEKDERKALDLVAYEFAQFVKKTKANLQIAHHLRRPPDGKAHEEGREISIQDLKGSAGIAQFSMTIVGYERNQQGERPDLTRVRILKNRFAGTTGVADTLKWDDILGRQLPTDDEYPSDEGKEKMPQFGHASGIGRAGGDQEY